MRYSIRAFLIASILLLASFSAVARGDDVKPFDKEAARTILLSMGFEKVNVGAILDDAGGSKTVLGVGILKGKDVQIRRVFQYDSDLGWFYYEFYDTDAKGQIVNPDFEPDLPLVTHVTLRIWSASGYRELKPLN